MMKYRHLSRTEIWKFMEVSMRRRILSGVAFAIMIASSLTACGSTPDSSGTVPETEEDSASYVWKCALNSTEGDNCYDQAVIFAEKIHELTGGQVEVELYGGASLGSTSEVLEGMSAGVADIICEGLGMLSPFTELANIDAMPYIYSGYDHFMAVWSSELGNQLKQEIGDASGFKLLGGAYRGPRIVTSTKRIDTIEGFQGFKLRAPNLEVYLKTWQWLDAAPTPLSMNEVYTALQQNTVEGQENPFADSLNYSFDEVCDYWIKTNHVYSCSLFMMDKSYFESLPQEIQSAVIEAAEYAGEEISAIQEQRDQEAEQQVLSEGCEVIEMDTVALAEYFDGFAEENFPDLADWVNRIKEADPAA